MEGANGKVVQAISGSHKVVDLGLDLSDIEEWVATLERTEDEEGNNTGYFDPRGDIGRMATDHVRPLSRIERPETLGGTKDVLRRRWEDIVRSE